jgi:hypothetical protein
MTGKNDLDMVKGREPCRSPYQSVKILLSSAADDVGLHHVLCRLRTHIHTNARILTLHAMSWSLEGV